MSVSVISYNILADSYIRPSLYRGVPPSVIDPGRRLASVLRRIRELSADVICLQEVEPHAFDLIKAELGALGYSAHYSQKRAKPDGCATFFRQRDSAVESQSLYFRDGSVGEGDSGHVALLLIARDPKGTIGIANTHLKWDPPAKPQTEQWGYRQALELLAHLRTKESPDTPWIICGDFNATPDSAIVELFGKSGFTDAYRDHGQMFTCAPSRKAKRIDYIFHSRSLSSDPIKLPAINDNTVLPSEEEPSDHLAIGAQIERMLS